MNAVQPTMPTRRLIGPEPMVYTPSHQTDIRRLFALVRYHLAMDASQRNDRVLERTK